MGSNHDISEVVGQGNAMQETIHHKHIVEAFIFRLLADELPQPCNWLYSKHPLGCVDGKEYAIFGMNFSIPPSPQSLNAEGRGCDGIYRGFKKYLDGAESDRMVRDDDGLRM